MAAPLCGRASLLLALVATPVTALDVPFLAGHVNDYAGMVPAETAARLEERLGELERRTGAQVAVLTVESLEGDPIEDFSLRVAETWKLGEKGKDNGVLFLVAKEDRKMRIEVGYGLEATLPDALAKRILDSVARPRFRAGDFGGGIEATVTAIAAAIEGDTAAIPAATGPTPHPAMQMPILARVGGMLIFVVVVGLFSLVALFGKGCQSWFLYVFLMPFYFAFPLAFAGPAGLLLFALWLVGFPILKYLLGKTPGGQRFLAAHPDLVQFVTTSGGSGSGGWSAGGSSFSGGGGSFGGGGASSSW